MRYTSISRTSKDSLAVHADCAGLLSAAENQKFEIHEKQQREEKSRYAELERLAYDDLTKTVGWIMMNEAFVDGSPGMNNYLVCPLFLLLHSKEHWGFHRLPRCFLSFPVISPVFSIIDSVWITRGNSSCESIKSLIKNLILPVRDIGNIEQTRSVTFSALRLPRKLTPATSAFV